MGLEQVFGADRSVDFTLVSDTNALLFTPMLSEVAGSSVEPTHISSPLRTCLHRTQVIRGHVTQIDQEKKRVVLAIDDRLRGSGPTVGATPKRTPSAIPKLMLLNVAARTTLPPKPAKRPMNTRLTNLSIWYSTTS